MTRALTPLCILAACVMVARAQPPSDDPITLELIMSDPDWMGNAPERPYWADDGRSFYYSVKRAGSEARDLVQMALDGTVLRTVSDEEKGSIDVPGGEWSADYARKIYSRNGDIFFKDIATGAVTQLTRTVESETSPRFMTGDAQIMYRRAGATLIRDLATGREWQPADLRAEDDPDAKKDEKSDYLREQQERLFEFVRERKRRQDEAREREKAERAADPTRPPSPWYLGAEVEIRDASLSPAGRWMLVRIVKKGAAEGRRDTMPQYVAESGYVETRSVRSKVGTGTERAETLVLLDLQTRERKDLDLSILPGITHDPLKELRERAEAARKAAKSDSPDSPAPPPAEAPPGADQPAETRTDKPKSDKPSPRPVAVRDIAWSDDGARLVVQIASLDNKDRWIAAVDLRNGVVVPLERDHDPAWINWRFARLGWLKDNSAIWFLSERTGWSHLYLRSAEGDSPARPLTGGEHEVSDPRLSRDGRHVYFTANAVHPGQHELWRVDISGGSPEQLTRLGGQNDAELSPDELALLIRHSTTVRPPELFVQPIGAAATQVTFTVSDRFASLPWIEPQIVAIASRHGGSIYARVYDRDEPTDPLKPAVVFIHGAGYLQNAHLGWSSYFREFMFHTLLVRRGYVVLDMDYRASAGYGRDWRTAIYGEMGTPELDDLEDGVAWLARHRRVDPARVGVYGGSYGGFLTLMALFTRPDLFACGAALRPVTDWAHYNHGYTSNILDVPQINPQAYERSSPIEFAAGLSRPLLICHGMQDDNVFFQDTVRLAQRLIELGKQDWEVALYPIEPHAFQTPSSWLDEYRRILKLFETHTR